MQCKFLSNNLLKEGKTHTLKRSGITGLYIEVKTIDECNKTCNEHTVLHKTTITGLVCFFPRVSYSTKFNKLLMKFRETIS